jgi:hypothetical protein
MPEKKRRGSSGFIMTQNEEHELTSNKKVWHMGCCSYTFSGKERDYEVNLERHAALWSGTDPG